jgi:phospholipid/cholesterol/gamma-HCH transport system substrate-binding protein
MNRPLIVGSFVLTALALFATGLFMIGNRHEAFARHAEFYVEFSNLSGIAKGAKVQVAGMDAGEVLDVRIPASPTTKFRVRLRINEALRGLVRTDSVVTIYTEGVVGNKFLSIGVGTAQAPAAAPEATLASKETTELSALLDQAKGTITDIDATVRNANSLITNADQLMTTVGGNLNSALSNASQLVTTVGGNLNSTLNEVKTTVGNANDVVVGLKEGKGPAGMILRDEALAAQIRKAVTNAQGATDALSHAAERASSLVADIQSRSFPQKIDETLASVKDTVSNLNATSKQVRQTVSDFTGPDEKGVTAAENLRESLSNVDTATANMADDTEALKHNFFLRGFFRSRGYFSLDRLSPDLYRKDRLFSRPDNRRAWLQADELFQLTADGAEQLTHKGRTLLNVTVAQYGATILQSPLVIEGYSDATDAAQRLATSRTRAILVRNYVQNHFQLDPSTIGSVALENQPPAGLDRGDWNGIAIVMLNSSRHR